MFAHAAIAKRLLPVLPVLTTFPTAAPALSSTPVVSVGANMRSLAAVLVSVLLALQAVGGSGRTLPGLPNRSLLFDGGRKFNYQQAGADWPENFPDCAGDAQSPINIDTEDIYESDFQELTARFGTFGIGRKVAVFNNGQSVEVTWEEAEETSVLLPVVGDMVTAAVDPLDPNHDEELDAPNNVTFTFANVELVQFHFHIGSENAIDGVLYAMEAHLVTRVKDVPACGDDGCNVVFAVLFKITEEVNFFLEPFLDKAPVEAGEDHAGKLPEGFVIDFDEIFPAEKSYYTWTGSFTTPPCTEGVTWILFDNFGKISQGQLTLLQSKMAAAHETCLEKAGDNAEAQTNCKFISDLKNNRAIQPNNGRLVTHVRAPTPATR